MLAARAFAVILVGLSLVSPVESEAGALVSVEASPPTIVADGKSRSKILVTVLDPSGAPVADDTQVRLTTSAGDITPLVYTSGGRAFGLLTSATIPQIAVVSAIVEDGSATVQVEYSSEEIDAGSASGGAIRMTGGSLAYCVDHDTVLGSGGVEIEYKGVRIGASGAQVCQRIGQIRAQGHISVAKGDITLAADALSLDLRSDHIHLLDSSDSSQVATYDVARLRPVEAPSGGNSPQTFESLTRSSGSSWIISERLTIIPRDKILFYKASIYVGDAKVVKVPYYAYSYQKRESILQQVRYTSSDGVRVDLPLYYRMTDSSTGALKLRYAGDGGEAGGYYRPRRGMSLGLEQDYSIRGWGQGRLFVDAIGSSTQAFELSHHLDFGYVGNGGRADISIRLQPRSSYAKSIHSTTVSLAGSLRSMNYSVYGYFGGSNIPRFDPFNPETINYLDQSTCTVRAVLRPKSPVISRNAGRISPSLTVGYGNLAPSSGESVSSCLYQSLGLQYAHNPFQSGRNSVSLDGTAAVTLTARGETGGAVRVGPTLRSSWNGGSGSIGCTVNLQGGTTDTAFALARYQLGSSLSLHGGSKWSSVSSVNYGLDSRRLNLYSSVNYRPARDWQIRSSYSLCWYAYTLNDALYRFRTSYLKVGVYRPLGLYEIGLAWSPDGQDYGVARGKRVWLELNGRNF